MDEKTILDRINGYRASREEWLGRRQAALRQADECMAKANMCGGAIEALEELLPIPKLETVLESAGVKVV